MPASTREAYRLRIRDLAEIEAEHELTMEPAAEQALERWAEQVESMLAVGGELDPIRDWGGKLLGATARLTANMHMIEHGAKGVLQPIGPATVEAAEAMARSHTSRHGHLRLLSAEGPVDAGACNVVRWIRRKEMASGSATRLLLPPGTTPLSVDLNAGFQRAAGRTEQAQQKTQWNAQEAASAGDGHAPTADPADGRKPLDNREIVAFVESVASADDANQWAILDSNQ